VPRRFDFDLGLPGDDASSTAWSPCASGTDVELWTIAGGSHVPRPSHAALDAIWGWMRAHAKR
jgi:hypothetical protein